jgi:hypothetical protein
MIDNLFSDLRHTKTDMHMEYTEYTSAEQPMGLFTFGMVYYPTNEISIKFSYSGADIISRDEMYRLLARLRPIMQGTITGSITKVMNDKRSSRIFELVVVVGEQPIEWWQYEVSSITQDLYNSMSEEERKDFLAAVGADLFANG